MKILYKDVFFILIGAIVLVCGLYLYARFIEPALLAVGRVTVETGKLTGTVTLAVLSDFHIGFGGMNTARVKKIMDAVAAEQPHAVVFLGDLFFARCRSVPDEAGLMGALSPTALAHVPKYAVCGNHDRRGTHVQSARRMLELAGWHLLVNQRAGLMGINLMGSDDALFGHPKVEPLADKGAFNLLLVHEPDVAGTLTGIDLQLSGHTHGGQVRLPFLGATVLPPLGRRYVRGLYSKPDGGQVYVSTGLGMSGLPFRFGVVPQINVVTIKGTAT